MKLRLNRLVLYKCFCRLIFRNRIKYYRKTATDGLKWFVLLFFVLSAGSCKKYPENRLWLKKPEKLNPFNRTQLRSYKVNGIDSLTLLNNFFGHAPGLVRDIKTTGFETLKYSSHTEYFIRYLGTSTVIYFTFNIINKGHGIILRMDPDTSIFSKNLFISKTTEWEIVRFSRKGPFKIKKQIENGNVYEIEIE